MSYGEKIAQARARKGYSRKGFSEQTEIPFSEHSVSKWEAGTRRIPDDAYPHITNNLDDMQLYFETWETLPGHVSIPYLDGSMIMRQGAAMSQLVKKEACKAMEHIEQYCWFKPPELREEEEVQRVIDELLDASASMINLVAVLCAESNLSMNLRDSRMLLLERRKEKGKRYWFYEQSLEVMEQIMDEW